MSQQTRTDYGTRFTVEQTPEEVYAAVLDVGTWWTGEIEGRADEVGEEFTYRHPPQHETRQRVVELEPGRRVVWRVVDSRLTFIAEPDEWTGTEIVFEIAPTDGGTELRFTHVGLVPDNECYGACSAGWSHYVGGSLRSLVTTGVGLPDPW
ncbi:SRPBCC family protein [Nocardioides mangrovi]|uniref:SRPBCC domain-containing protein n=1 Tax=Nocardioides mangrovi TaxID=2874580 RepID=A0ABS7UAH4_9ACTN|nr:SRPBCC domain-containing protein [Nocardioides mangrovi]MBZ5737840.1 SRPBCC domain-containing protein [Nocardioides mangrovi]